MYGLTSAKVLQILNFFDTIYRNKGNKNIQSEGNFFYEETL